MTSRVMGPSASALPSDVRRWLCPADRGETCVGLCPCFALCLLIYWARRRRIKSIAEKLRRVEGGA